MKIFIKGTFKYSFKYNLILFLYIVVLTLKNIFKLKNKMNITTNQFRMKRCFLFLIIIFLVTSCSKDDVSNNEESTFVTVNVAKAGTLSDLISSKKKYQITNLTITGYLNGTDIKFIREMAGCYVKNKFTEGKLSVLDLVGANIVSGGSNYCLDYSTSTNKIGAYTFIDCSKLTSIKLPNNITSIDDLAFSGLEGLISVNIPDGVTRIGDCAFYHCKGLTSIAIPNSVTSIGEYAFCSCTGLTSIAIPNGVTRIGKLTFANCAGLTSITIPNGVTYIGDLAFGETNLTSITIPNNVTYLGNNVFDGCDELNEIHFKTLIPPTVNVNTFENGSSTTTRFYAGSCKLYIPKGTVSAYRGIVWGKFANIIEE